jgi:uncharacterized protein DUF4245
MTRIPAAVAGLALVAVTAVACGSDDGSDTTASDPSSSSSATSPSASDSPTDAPTPTATASETATASPDPVSSPIIDKAVKDAIKDDFPALIPSGVPAGWTVVSATYAGKGGGVWQIALTDPSGAPVTLMQSTASAADLVARLIPDGEAAGNVRLSGTGKWAVYTGMGAAGLAKDLSGTGAVVVGADKDTVVALADQLLTAEDAGSGDGG